MSPSTRLRWLICAVALSGLLGCGGGSGAPSGTAASSVPPPHAAPVTEPRAPDGARPAAVRVDALIPPAGRSTGSVRVPILTYHRVAPLSAVGQLDLKVDPRNFQAELAALSAGGYHTITQAQLFRALYHHATLPRRPVLISVDDGYVDDITQILPALRRFHMVATFFVITGRMTEPGFLTAYQIRQLAAARMDIGDHTAHHVDLRRLTALQLRSETAGSRQALERVLGHPVYFFAYPFGAYNEQVLAAVRAAGFTLAYTTAAGITEAAGSPLTMPRVHVGRALSPSGLLAQLGGA